MNEGALRSSPLSRVSDRVGTRKSWRVPKQWRNPVGLVGLGIVSVAALAAVFAPALAPHSVSEPVGKRLLGPGRGHLLGTDELGRDTFSRVIFGARVSFQVSILSVLVALVIGGLLGLAGGYFGGRLDSITMRLVDILFAPDLCLRS
jgi:peptide/nickel transport system permease protein